MMNYHNMTTAGLQSSSASISLPPISSIDFRVQAAHHSPQDVVQPLPPPPPPRQLPPLPYYHNGGRIPQQPEYVQPRPMYAGGMQVPNPYQLVSSRIPLPSTTDPSLIVAPTRHKTKEVKRRTKTGCLTCRKRRIKCDEGRPECRNCMKSKRQCLGYDPVFQSQGPHSIHPAPASTSNAAAITSSSSTNNQARHYTVTPSSPSTTSHNTSLTTTSPRDTVDFSYNKHPELLPHLNQPYKMDNTSNIGMPSYQSSSRPRKSVEEICSVAGTKLPPVPAIPPDSVPNLDPIGKVFDMNFAPGLDMLLESEKHWFANEGFHLVAGNRVMLGLVLAYLTLISNNADKPLGEDATLASQEARVTWGSLSLCVGMDNDGGKEADKLARRFKIIESILTGEPLSAPPASMSEFVHQDEIEEHKETEPELKEDEPDAKASVFDKQVTRRREEFWKTLEFIAIAQGRGDEGFEDVKEAMEQAKLLADGKENRDIIYATLLLGWGKNGDPSSERELAKRFLQTEAMGRATNLVFATIAGMSLRAFGEQEID